MAGVSAQGLTFVFGGTTMTVTSVQVSDSQDLVDGSHLGIAPNGRKEFVGGFTSQREVSVDVIATSITTVGASGVMQISGPLVFSGNATVVSANIGGSVGDLVKGSITLRLA